jgi:hypothetical protein
MPTYIKMTCGGCDAEAQVVLPPRTFVSVSGKSWGLGSYRYPTIAEAVEPTGWTHSDPYTGCTYCPECWKDIEHGERDAEDRFDADPHRHV